MSIHCYEYRKKIFESFTLSETVKSNKTCSGTKCIGFCSSITEKYLEALRSLWMEGGRGELKQEISLIYFFPPTLVNWSNFIYLAQRHDANSTGFILQNKK